MNKKQTLNEEIVRIKGMMGINEGKWVYVPDEGEDEESQYDDYSGDFDDESEIDFADPGGNSALRASSPDNPRNRPCPTCGEKNKLTAKDVHLGYQCDNCADTAERGY